MTSNYISLLSARPTDNRDRVPIDIDPDVRKRLIDLLWMPEMRGIGYSAFINRACEAAETEIMNKRSGR